MQTSEERNRKIANVLETYFSDACLLWDKVMLNKVVSDPEGSKLNSKRIIMGINNPKNNKNSGIVRIPFQVTEV